MELLLIILGSLMSTVLSQPGFHRVHGYYQHEVPIQGRYQGPPAPLNPDGTVAYTTEFREAASIHQAAHAEEFRRLAAADALAAAHPDLPSHFNHHEFQPHHFGRYRRSSHGYSFRPSYVPAPLNPDGTVAQTPEVKELAAAHVSAHSRQLELLARQDAKAKSAGQDDESYAHLGHNQHAFTTGFHHYSLFNDKSTNIQGYHARRYRRGIVGHYSSLYRSGHQESYQNPGAPLNSDGTVAHTAEFSATAAGLRAAHQANHARQLALLAQQGALAAAAGPDSPAYYDSPHQHSTSFLNFGSGRHPYAQTYLTHYSPAFRTSYQATEAPLNPDGTVAHTPEYRAIATAHAALHRH